MNDDGQFGGTGQFHLADEDFLLNVSRRVVVVVVEADFSPGDDFIVARKLLKFGKVRILRHLCFMRMYADGRVNRFVLLGYFDGAVECAGTVSCADSKHVRDSGLASTCDYLQAIRVEAGAIKVAMRVDEHGLL